MPRISYDGLDLNVDILFDLPQREGVGAILHDVSMGHRNVAAVSAPVWTLAGSVMTLEFDGGADYLWASNANTTDLDFTSGDYSLGCWINWTDTSTSEIIMGRYELNVGGWELYLFDSGLIEYLTLRHHHAGTLVGGNPRSACYSIGWAPSSGWCLIGVSRTGGGEAQMYRNGVVLGMVTGGLIDPETTTSDLVIGAKYNKLTDFYQGGLYRPRIWSRVLTAAEWRGLYNREIGLLS